MTIFLWFFELFLSLTYWKILTKMGSSDQWEKSPAFSKILSIGSFNFQMSSCQSITFRRNYDIIIKKIKTVKTTALVNHVHKVYWDVIRNDHKRSKVGCQPKSDVVFHTGRNCFNLFQISFSEITVDAHPGVSKDQKFSEKFKNTHCQVDYPAKME